MCKEGQAAQRLGMTDLRKLFWDRVAEYQYGLRKRRSTTSASLTPFIHLSGTRFQPTKPPTSIVLMAIDLSEAFNMHAAESFVNTQAVARALMAHAKALQALSGEYKLKITTIQS